MAVSAVPAFRHAFDPEAALAGLLDDLSEPGRGSADMNQHERVARSFACKAAIKAGSPLAREEMAELIDRLFDTRLPYDDVHGRPACLLSAADLVVTRSLRRPATGSPPLPRVRVTDRGRQ